MIKRKSAFLFLCVAVLINTVMVNILLVQGKYSSANNDLLPFLCGDHKRSPPEISSRLQNTNALECYRCEADTLNACRFNSPHLTVVGCGVEHYNFYRICIMRVIYDNQLKKANVTLGCDLIGRKAVIRDIPQCQIDNEGRYELRVCHICMEDLCTFEGAAHTASPRLISLLCFPLMYLFTKFVLQ